MIPIQVSQDQAPGLESQEHVIVLIRFNDEQGFLARFAEAQARDFATDDVARATPRLGEDVRDERGGGGFAMGPCHSQDLASLQQGPQQVFALDHGQAPGLGLLHLRVGWGNG